MSCSRCGAPNPYGARFCSSCGAVQEVAAAPAPVVPFPPAQPAAHTTRGPWTIILVVGLLVLLAAGGIGGYLLLGAASSRPLVCEDGKCPTIDPARGGTLTVHSKDSFLSRVVVQVPPGAVAAPVAIEMAQASDPLDFTISTQHHAVAIGRTVRMQPHGLHFLHPLEVRLPFEPARVKGAPATAHVRVALAAGPGQKIEWIEPERIDSQQGVVVFRMPHFSDAAVSVSVPDESGGDRPVIKPSEPEPPTPGLPPAAPAPPVCSPEMLRALCRGTGGSQGAAGRGGGGPECETTWKGDFWENVAAIPGTSYVFTGGAAFPGQRTARLGLYLFLEDGAGIPMKPLPWGYNPKPIRTGREVDLYNQIKAHVEKHKGEPLSQDDIMNLALQATRETKDGKCTQNAMSAMLTAHNVIRLLARPENWKGHIIRNHKLCEVGAELEECNAAARREAEGGIYGHDADDPAFPILQDLAGGPAVPGSQLSLPQILEKQGRLSLTKGADVDWVPRTFTDLGVFSEPPGLRTVCPPNNDTCKASHAAGCRYYYWTGMMGMAGLGQMLTSYGFGNEVSDKTKLGEKARGDYEVNCARDGAAMAKCMEQVVSGEVPLPCHQKSSEPPKPEPSAGGTFGCRAVCMCRCERWGVDQIRQAWQEKKGDVACVPMPDSHCDRRTACTHIPADKRVTASELSSCEPREAPRPSKGHY